MSLLITSYSALGLIGMGTLFFIAGLLHRHPVLAKWDARSFEWLHIRLRQHSSFFRFVWPLGTTPVCVVLLAIIYIASWQVGLVATVTYLVAAAIERPIKRKFHRPRPFEALADVQAQQPNHPHDPSHPSGDSLRVWYLALVFPAVFGLPWPVTLLTCSIAVILSLGRIALGVHYPLDVLGGAGLGLVAAGFAAIGYQLAVIS
jgi:membrane-associated phospholipid phosphatase